MSGAYPYGINSTFYYTNAGQDLHSLKEVVHPSTTFLVAEAYNGYGVNTPSIFDNTLYGVNTDLDPPVVYPRHTMRGLNCVFVDGHLEALRQHWDWALTYGGASTRWCGYGNFVIYGP
ncbi:MAG: hypothetical protein HY360_25060 [Verrucomicrobia bacterium]|nr:hypothetical protein [Verrucomicrobiota bacterium]